jgi:hypothetical protein
MRITLARLIISFVGAMMLISPVFVKAESHSLAIITFLFTIAWIWTMLVAESTQTNKKHRYIFWSMACLLSFLVPMSAAYAMNVPILRGATGSLIVFLIFTLAIGIRVIGFKQGAGKEDSEDPI